MTALDQALRLCHRMPVFPCLPNKSPACKRGYLDATTEPQKVVELWGKSNAPLIGVPTGERSGFDVLDIDPRHGGDAWLAESTEALPITRRHKTQSGGWHILFRHADGVKNTASKIAPGVDTRGQGGYVIYWPAMGCEVENPKVLDDWPRWLLKILNPPRRQYAPVAAPATKAEANTRANLMIERAYDKVRNAAPGQRHYAIRAAAATIGGLERFLERGTDAVLNDLVTLIMQAGGEDRANAEKTVAWALEKGSRSPLLARHG